MKEYIERDSLIKIFTTNEKVDKVSLSFVRAVIKNAVPAADVVEVRHGRWEEYWDDEYLTYSHKCSLCGEFPLTKEETMHDEVLSKYCPNCGAKMDKEE